MSFFVVKKEKMLLSALMVFTLLIVGYYFAGNLQQPVDIAIPADVTEDKKKNEDKDVEAPNNDQENQGTPGQVILYDSSQDEFISLRLTRDHDRAQILDELRVTMANANVTAEEIAKAKSMYDEIIDTANIEDTIEDKIMSLGFRDCVYMRTGEKVQVVVQSDHVTPEQYLEILDIVSNQSGQLHRNIEVSYYR